jgi:hypothetical protein
MLTPLSASSKGLAVIQKGLTSIEVQELFDGKGNYDFDYEIKAVRKGHEDYQIIRNPKKISTVEKLKSRNLKSTKILKQKNH